MINLQEMVLQQVKQDYADGKLDAEVLTICDVFGMHEENDSKKILCIIAEQRINETR